MFIQKYISPLPGIFKLRYLGILSMLAMSLFVSGMVWPPAPEKARIAYLYSISSPEDLKITKKGGEKFLEFIFGENKGEIAALMKPQSVFSQNGVVLATDISLGCVHVFNKQKNTYFQIKQAGKEKLLLPVAAVSDKSGNIYVSDSKLGKVFVFSAEGKFVRELGRGEFQRPTGLAIDQALGRLYVVDTLAGLINVFSLEGMFIYKIGAPGESTGNFNHPTYIAVDKLGDIYVVDSLNFRVQILSKTGQFKEVLGRAGRVPGTFSRPKGIAVDSDDNVYVTDASFDNVQIFDTQGNLLLFFGESGNKDGQFWQPAGMHVDENDTIYVADSFNSRIEVFKYIK